MYRNFPFFSPRKRLAYLRWCNNFLQKYLPCRTLTPIYCHQPTVHFLICRFHTSTGDLEEVIQCSTVVHLLSWFHPYQTVQICLTLLCEWQKNLFNSSLLTFLQCAVISSLLKKNNLDPSVINNYRLTSISKKNSCLLHCWHFNSKA